VARQREPGREPELIALDAAPLRTDRLRLEPLTTRDVDALFPLLDDPALHSFIGGDPMTREELERWVGAVVAGSSPSANEIWCNWTVRRAEDGEVVGTAQATIVDDEATLAWVTGTKWQGRGYAKEAATGVVAWLRSQGIAKIRANIHPEHDASAGVARAIGLTATDDVVDGETVWRSG
jgi:RimJ/RimL family protein N-acetyltransferase